MDILAIDAGTSSVKVATLDVATGQPTSEIVRQSYELHQPSSNIAELLPDLLWNAITSCVRQIKSTTKIEGIGFSCLSPCLILLDNQEKPLTNLITHLDRRSRSVATSLQQTQGPKFLLETGNKPLPGGISGIVFKSLMEQDKQLAGKVNYYLHLNGWLGLKTTGRTGFDPGNACFTGVCSYRDLRWSPFWCQQLGIQTGWLPPILSGDATLGHLLPEVATAWNLPAKIPVKLGLADTSSAIRCVDLKPGEMLHVVGTTQVLTQLTEQPLPSTQRLTRHLGLGKWYMHVAHNPVGGVALDWVHDLCFADQTKEQFYGSTLQESMQGQTEVILDPPFLGGDRLQIEEKRACLNQLSLASNRMDVLRSILQAMQQGHQTALQTMDFSTPPKKVYLSGGGSRWIKELLPEYQQIDLVEVEEASLRGVASLFRS